MSAENAVTRTGPKSVLAFQNGYKIKKTLCNTPSSGIPIRKENFRSCAVSWWLRPEGIINSSGPGLDHKHTIKIHQNEISVTLFTPQRADLIQLSCPQTWSVSSVLGEGRPPSGQDDRQLGPVEGCKGIPSSPLLANASKCEIKLQPSITLR